MDFGSFAMVGHDGLRLTCAMIQRPEQELIGVIGLGLMGTALTDRLLDHGYRVAVWNRTREKAAPRIAKGAEWSDNPPAICARVIISRYTTEVVEGVLDDQGQGISGFGADKCLIRDQDPRDTPLSSTAASTRRLAGKTVRLHFHLRSANRFAVTGSPAGT